MANVLFHYLWWRTIPQINVKELETRLDNWAFAVEICTAIVVIGLIVEYWPDLRDYEQKSNRTKWFHLIGAMLVVLGVAGEGLFPFLSRTDQHSLQTVNDELLIEANERAIQANTRAFEANKRAIQADRQAEIANGRASSAVAGLQQQVAKLAETNEHLAGVENDVADRIFAPDQVCSDLLMKHEDQFYYIDSTVDSEPAQLSEQINSGLTNARWKGDGTRQGSSAITTWHIKGVQVRTTIDFVRYGKMSTGMRAAIQRSMSAGHDLVACLTRSGIEARWVADQGVGVQEVWIVIGSKPRFHRQPRP